MRIHGQSPSAWVSAVFATMAAMGTGSVAFASSTASTVEFEPFSAFENYAAVTDSSKLPGVSSEPTPEPLVYSVCSESSTWIRPNADEQASYLQSDPRYSTMASDVVQTEAQTFWEKDAIAFTSYGLSARQEPIYFSGLWSLLEQEPIWAQCYDAERISQINSGQLAELWLIGHQIQSIQWTGDRYVVTVEATGVGAQFVQFPRHETFRELPLQLVTEDDVSLDFVSVGQFSPL